MANRITIKELDSELNRFNSLFSELEDVEAKINNAITIISESGFKTLSHGPMEKLNKLKGVVTEEKESIATGAIALQNSKETFENVDRQLSKLMCDSLNLGDNYVPSEQKVEKDVSSDNASRVGITYMNQREKDDKYVYDSKNYSYKYDVACGINCDSMIASYFGIDDLTPGKLIDANKGSALFDTVAVKKLFGDYGISINSKKSGVGVADLKIALDKYKSDPKNVAPPMVSIKMPGNHYVIVTDILPNGDYSIIDPNMNSRSVLKVSNSISQNKEGYVSPITSVTIFSKN